MSISSHKVQHQAKELYIQYQQLLMLYKNLPSAIGIGLLNAVVATVVLWPDVDQYLLMIWLGLMIVLVMLRVTVFFVYQRAPSLDQQGKTWLHLFLAGVIASGVMWGALSLLFFNQATMEQQMFIAFVIAGMCAGAVTTLSYNISSVSIFATLTLVPLLYVLLGGDSVVRYAMVFMTVVFWVGMMSSAFRWYKNEYAGFSERFDAMERQRMLESNQVRIQTLIDSALDGIVMTDINGTIQVFNPSAERMFGYTQVEALGANVSILMPDNHAFSHEQYIKQYFRGKQANLMGVSRELYGKRKNGLIFPLEINLSEMTIHGQVMFSAILRDITARRELENDLRTASRMAQDANRAKSEFLSGLSHEIRTPMNAIVGFADLLEHDDRLVEDQQDYVMEIKRAGGHLIELMSDVLDLSKIEAGKIKLDMSSIDVLDAINDALSLVQHMASARQITIHPELPEPGTEMVYADRTRLKQVLLNLLSNATKYNREKGEIFVRCYREGQGGVVIAIRDTGLGISEVQQRKLFKPFERLDAEGTKIEGTGLGLMLTKHFVEVMGGEIQLHSQPGKGTEFKVILKAGDVGMQTILHGS